MDTAPPNTLSDVTREPGPAVPPVLSDVTREPGQAAPPVLYLMLLENQDKQYQPVLYLMLLENHGHSTTKYFIWCY